MRRAQTEIVGLLIIVLLVSFMLLFAFRQIITSEPEDFTSEKNENLAESWMYAMLSTDTNCTSNKDMEDLIEDCGLWHSAGPTDLTCQDGRTSCEYLKDTVGKLLNSTVLNWSKPYIFYVTQPGNTQSHIIELKAGNFSHYSGCQPHGQMYNVGPSFQTMEVKVGIGNCEYLLN